MYKLQRSLYAWQQTRIANGVLSIFGLQRTPEFVRLKRLKALSFSLLYIFTFQQSNALNNAYNAQKKLLQGAVRYFGAKTCNEIGHLRFLMSKYNYSVLT